MMRTSGKRTLQMMKARRNCAVVSECAGASRSPIAALLRYSTLTFSVCLSLACGNCEDPQQPIPATLGLRISGERIVLRGADSDSVCIHTHAG